MDAFNRAVTLTAIGARMAAIEAYEEAIATGERDICAWAAFNVAALQADDPWAASSAYLDAIDTGHPDVAPKAAFNLASVLAAEGDLAGARTLLEMALDFEHQDVSARAALKLQLLAAERVLDNSVPGEVVTRRIPRPVHLRRSRPHRNAHCARRLRGSH